MLAKISITDKCGAHCTTCLQHRVEPKRTMSPEMLSNVLTLLASHCNEFFINNTGDYLSLENHQEYSDVLSQFFETHSARMSTTTNAGFNGKPRLNCSIIICSLNAVTHEMFDRHVGIACGFQKVIENIRYLAQTHGIVEVHSLVHVGNPNPSSRLLFLLDDLNISIRVSEKLENQLQSDVLEKRLTCNYLRTINVTPKGEIRLCAHDFFNSTILGNIDDIPAALKKQAIYREQHEQKVFSGICKQCNYNVAEPGKIWYIKHRVTRRKTCQ